MQRRRCLTACLIAFWCLLSSSSIAQNGADSHIKRPIAAVKTTTPPVIDGDLSDPAWKDAPKATVFLDHQQGGAVADQTVACILYDDKYIYIGFRCKDSQPDQITARETVRDSKYQGRGDFGDSEDNVEVVFDPFQTHQWNDLTRFSMNAIGTCSARLGGGRGNKVEWKGDWDGAAKRVADGWMAEMRIPWGILNYPNSRQPVTMGINFTRFQYRTKIQSIWSNTGPQGFLDLEGQWTGVQVPVNAFHPQLSLLPYILPNLQNRSLGPRSGLDARYSITPELTAVGTLNPDFGTIEGAVEGIQFSRSERFVPERRPFFLEGSDYFNVGDSYAIGRYFYPRRIEVFDFGTKVYGKVTPTDTLGVLGTLGYGRQNDVVARYRHDFSATSSGGFFFTQKSAPDDNNTVGVLDQHNRWGKLGLDSEWGISTGSMAGGGAKRVNFNYQDKHLFSYIAYLEVSPIFRDANGLIGFTDYRGIHIYEDWGAEFRKGFWRSLDVTVFPQYDWHTDGRPFQRGGGINVSLNTRSDWGINLGANYNKFDDQTDATVGLRLTSGISNRFRQWGIELDTGQQADRPWSFVGPQFSIRTFRRLDLAYGGSIQNLDGITQQHIFTFNYEFSPTHAFGGRIVIQNADTNWYLSYRSSGAKGTEVFFILGDPNANRFVKRFAVKFVFAL